MDGYLRFPKEVMQRLNIGRTTAFNLVSTNYGTSEPKLLSFKVAGKRWVSEEVLKNYVFESEIGAIDTNPNYWECDCIEDSCIKPKYVSVYCMDCDRHERECPDARVEDIDKVYSKKDQAFIEEKSEVYQKGRKEVYNE